MSALAQTTPETAPLWQDLFLEQFASSQAGFELFEFERSAGDFRYHQFVCRFQDAYGRACTTFGRSQDRKLAAVKCAAEAIERTVMTGFFKKHPRQFAELQNSNGWAVHSFTENAEQAATLELVERHLLLKSWLLHGWNGFDLVRKASTGEIDLYFLKAIQQSEEYAAGLVIAKSPIYAGVSIGQCIGASSRTSSYYFWENGIFEAIDRLVMLNGQNIELRNEASSWILCESKRLLETPFDFSQLRSRGDQFVETLPRVKVTGFDLSMRFNGLPVSAAFAQSEELIPLFPSRDLSSEFYTYIAPILDLHGVPRSAHILGHPIL